MNNTIDFKTAKTIDNMSKKRANLIHYKSNNPCHR